MKGGTGGLGREKIHVVIDFQGMIDSAKSS